MGRHRLGIRRAQIIIDDPIQWKKERSNLITSPGEHVKRRELYDQGLSDSELSKALFICENAVRYWRETQTPPLPPNTKKNTRLAVREQLYTTGMTDQEICRAQKCSKMAIRDWRIKRGLPQNKKEKVGKRYASN